MPTLRLTRRHCSSEARPTFGILAAEWTLGGTCGSALWYFWSMFKGGEISGSGLAKLVARTAIHGVKLYDSYVTQDSAPTKYDCSACVFLRCEALNVAPAAAACGAIAGVAIGPSL